MSENLSCIMRRLTAFVHGDVQKVGYRSRVVTIAKAFGLKGCIQNIPDGRVKITAEGDKENLEKFVKAIKIENALIKVDKIDYDYANPTGEFEDFYKLVEQGETDERLDTAAEYLKELVDITRNGFTDLKEVIIGESQKTRDELGGIIKDESQKTRDTVKDESQKTRDELGGIIKDESQKTRETVKDESQKTRETVKDESQKTREEMRSVFGTHFSKIEDDIDQIKDGIGRS